MSTPPEFVLIGGKRFVADSFVANDGQTYYVTRDKLTFGLEAGGDVAPDNPLPTTDAGVATLVSALTAASHTDLAAILSKLSGDPATQTTLAAVLAKLSGDPATQTGLTTLHADLTALLTELLQKVEPADLSALATAANQSAGNTSLAAIASALAGTLTTALPTGAATAANQTSANTKLDGVKTSVDAVTTKLTADPATGAGQTAQGTKLDTLHADLGVATPTTLPGSTGQVGTGTILLGFTARETSGSASAVIRLRATNATTGAILATVALAPGESARDWFGPSGIAAAGGIFLQIVSGAVEGGVHAR